MHEASLPHEFQYSSAAHQAETAVAGIWLFLATEVVFFGALFLAWIFARHFNQAGFDAGAQQTALGVGTINTVILTTGSLAYSLGAVFIEEGNARRLIQWCAAAWVLGLAFMVLKFGIEWRDDFEHHMFPGAGLRNQRPPSRRGTAFLGVLFLRHLYPRFASHGRTGARGMGHFPGTAGSIFVKLLFARSRRGLTGPLSILSGSFCTR